MAFQARSTIANHVQATMIPIVSVIIPLYKCESFIADTLKSVLDQTFQNFEIIVINDGSPDDSHAAVQPFLKDSRIKYVTQTNQGAAEARNKGISLATGKYIALLDCDDLWLPRKLQVQVDFMERHPEYVLAHADYEYIDIQGRQLEPPHESWQFPDWQERMDGICFENLIAQQRVIPSTVIIRATTLNMPEIFRQKFFPADDYDLWLRLARRGPFALIRDKLAQYRWHGGNFSSNWLRIDVCTTEVLENMLIEYPNIRQELSSAVIYNRLHTLYTTIATEYTRRQDWKAANKYWRKSIITRPNCLKCYQMLLLGSIPANLRRTIVWWLHKYRVNKSKNSKIV